MKRAAIDYTGPEGYVTSVQWSVEDQTIEIIQRDELGRQVGRIDLGARMISGDDADDLSEMLELAIAEAIPVDIEVDAEEPAEEEDD